MPIYEFECQKCGDRFEELKNLGQRDKPTTCPSCGKKAKRVLSGFAVGRGSAPSSSAGAAASRSSCGWSGG